MVWVREVVVDSGSVCALAVVDNGRASVEVMVGVRDERVVVVDMSMCSEVFLVRTGTVVFHWWVEKGLVMLAGSVMSWSPTVDSRDSGTVGRSHAGRLLTDSSVSKKHLENEIIEIFNMGE